MTDGAISAVAASDDPDRGRQLLGRHVLQQEAAGAGAQRREDVLVEVEGREDEDPGRRARRSAAIRRVASTPSITGIRMSMSTTSGSRRRTWSPPSAAVGRLADHLEVGLRLEDHAEPRRSIGWSSTSTSRMVTRPVARSGRRARTREAASARGPASAPRRRWSRARACRRARARRPRLAQARAPRPPPSSVTSMLDGIGRVASVHGRRVAAGVLERVRERLLHDAVRREVEPRRERPDRRPRPRARRAGPRRAPGRSSSPSWSTPGWRRSTAASSLARSTPSMRPHLAQRLASRRLDSGRATLAVRCEVSAARRRGLDDHDAHVVRHHVVQLARDPGPFRGGGDRACW